MSCHAIRLFWVKSVDSTKCIHLFCCKAASCTIIDSPSSMVFSLRGFSLNLFWYLLYRSFVSFANQVYNLFDTHEVYISELIFLII